MSGQSHHHVRAQQGPHLGDGQIVLADVEDVRAHQCGDVRPVVDREQLPMFLRHRGHDLQRRDLVAGVDGFDNGLAEEEPFFRSTIIRVLRILERVLQLQDIFLDILVPLAPELQASVGGHRPVSSFVKLDQALLFSPDYVPAVLAYVGYPAHHEAVFLAVRILALLITPSTSRQLAVLVDRSSDSERILDGFAHILDAETLVDPENAEIVASKVAGAGAPGLPEP